MCSDGAWLNGLSKLVSAANRKPVEPWCLRPNEGEAKREQDEAGDGHDLRGQQPRACVSSSALLAQTNSDNAVERR